MDATELHYISAKGIEGVDPRFVREGLFRAREKTWDVLHEIRSQLVPGMTEDDARRLALKIFADHRVTKHWHRPYIRFGKGTTLTFNDPIQPDYRLREGDPLYLDLGPVWADAELGLEYEGDVGDTFVLGSNPAAEKCAETARRIFAAAQTRWKKSLLTGQEIYAFMSERTEQLGYKMLKGVDGHRLSDFPHQKYTRERLANLPFNPVTDLWVLELMIVDPEMRFGAFYEDLLV